jgi:hypothetical protein
MTKMILDGWQSIGKAEEGRPYGHVPGHYFHDVLVEISRRGDRFRVAIRKQTGSDQGYDEIHSENTVVGRGDSIREAAAQAKSLALEAGFNRSCGGGGRSNARAQHDQRDRAWENCSRARHETTNRREPPRERLRHAVNSRAHGNLSAGRVSA